MKVKLTRPTTWNSAPNNDGILGQLDVFSDKGDVLGSWFSIEQPWRDNKPGYSCIPLGTYPIKFQWSPKHQKNNYHVLGVQGRDQNDDPANIEIHVADYAGDPMAENPLTNRPYITNLEGCVALGKGVQTLNYQRALSNSTGAIAEFEGVMGGQDSILEVVAA
ncbi:MAG: hypothetical protein KGL39_38850 [Patescibacteria group bacterium]|nr:hypothetical protein [Patescibacteria group bacterium]